MTFSDTSGNKMLLMLMGARVEGLACAELGARILISASENFPQFPRCKIQIHTQRDASLSEARHTEYGAMGLIKRAVIYKSRVG